MLYCFCCYTILYKNLAGEGIERIVGKDQGGADFGIAIHAEKEILMTVVEKDVRDKVLHSLYKKMGMQQKAQGVVFAMPVSDVTGLAMPLDEAE